MVLGDFGKARCVLVRLLVLSAVLYSHNLAAIAHAEEPVEYQEEPQFGGTPDDGAATSSECPGGCAKRHFPGERENPGKIEQRVSRILDPRGDSGTKLPGKGDTPATE
ncbi:MAG: hypothetical protein IPJ71_09675 [Bdellovibrionales bacterium]|nr:hypothetical protein [Bdellovibrionales bacterium]